MKNSDAVYITRHEEMIGSAILRRLKKDGFGRLLLKELASQSVPQPVDDAERQQLVRDVLGDRPAWEADR